MSYDEQLAERVRRILDGPLEFREQKMFGGLAFISRGHMFCGIVHDQLMVRLGSEEAEQALDRPHVRPMDFTGKPMRTMVYVAPQGIRTDADLEGWVECGLSYVETLPPKGGGSSHRVP
jgi:TfoX/Sxy family transcriptional regulator of competence genes